MQIQQICHASKRIPSSMFSRARNKSLLLVLSKVSPKKEEVCLFFCFCSKIFCFFILHCQEYFYFPKNRYCDFSLWALQKFTKPPNFIRMVLRFINTTIFVERKSTQAFQLSVMVDWVVEVHDSKNFFVCLIFLQICLIRYLFRKILSLLFH